jgi:hypothetical protein
VAGECDQALARALEQAASALAAAEGREPLLAADLAGHLARALDPLVGRLSMAIRDDRVRLKGWPEATEPVDIAVRGRLAGRQRAVIECGWWDDDERRRDTVRSACLVTSAARDGAGDGYLVAAAPVDAWERAGPAVAIFREGERATLPLLRDAGVDRVAGGPALVPGRLASAPVARASLAGHEDGWELRAVRVAPAGGDLRVG